MAVKFQSTLPRGERRDGYIVLEDNEDFNPRSREGSDQTVANAMANYIISIHAPARGATTRYAPMCILIGISIHAPARGATPKLTNFYPK